MAILLMAGANLRSLRAPPHPRPQEGVGQTCLMLAADSPKKMQLLLDHGADPAQKAADGCGLAEHLRKELAQAEIWLMERPEKKRAGSHYEKMRDARAASLAMIAP